MEIILDHYRNPRNYGQLEAPDIRARDSNPLCGDVIEVQLKLTPERYVQDAKFTGRGCAISLASASMLTQSVKGKSLEELRILGKDDVLRMLGIEVSAVRLKCALLPLKVLKTGIYDFLGARLPPDQEP